MHTVVGYILIGMAAAIVCTFGRWRERKVAAGKK